ncbi:unnamed protein product [Cochlearia groenlandica]
MSGQEGNYVDMFGALSLGDDNHQDQDGIDIMSMHITPQETQELEKFFEECPNPSEEQKAELGERLNMEIEEVECWLLQAKVKEETYRESVTLNKEKERLIAEHKRLKDLMKLPLPCKICRGPAKVAMAAQQQLVEEKPEFSMSDLAIKAMEELVMLGEVDSPLWRKDSTKSKTETLNFEEYTSFFKNNGLVEPSGYVAEASREMGLVPMNSLDLVQTFMNMEKWGNVFASKVNVVAPTDALIPFDDENSLQMIQATYHVISPVVPNRQVEFLRYCKNIKKGLWVVVDVTPIEQNPNSSYVDISYRRLPSGLIIEEVDNGFSKVTWIEQAEYYENFIHQLFMVSMGLGAKSWFAILQRYCEALSTISSINDAKVYEGMCSKGATEMLKLGQRVTHNYYASINGYPYRLWGTIPVVNDRKDIRMVINMNVPGMFDGVFLSASTSVWFEANQQKMFDYLNNQSFRNQWDDGFFFENATSIEEKFKIQKSTSHGNYVSLLQATDEDGMAVLQEAWSDESGAFLVYAQVGKNDMENIMEGKEDSDSVKILASGFSILPFGKNKGDDSDVGGGCLVTLGIQILFGDDPNDDKLGPNFATKAEEIVMGIMGKIKAGLNEET